MPKQAADALSMKVRVHKQVIEVFSIPEGNVATQVGAVLRYEMHIVWGAETCRNGWCLNTLKEHCGLWRSRIRKD